MGPLYLCKRLHSCQKYASVFRVYYVVAICMGFVLIFLLGPGHAQVRPAHTKPRPGHRPGPGPQNVGPDPARPGPAWPGPRNLVFLCDTFKVGNRVVGYVGSVVQACKGPFTIVQACKGPFSIVQTRKGPFQFVQACKGPFPIVKIYVFVNSVLMFLRAPPPHPESVL